MSIMWKNPNPPPQKKLGRLSFFFRAQQKKILKNPQNIGPENNKKTSTRETFRQTNLKKDEKNL